MLVLEVIQVRSHPQALNSSPTFNVAHGHLDGSLASFTDIVLAVVVRDDAVLQDEPAWLPAWGGEKYELSTKTAQVCLLLHY